MTTDDPQMHTTGLQSSQQASANEVLVRHIGTWVHVPARWGIVELLAVPDGLPQTYSDFRLTKGGRKSAALWELYA